MSVGVCAPMSGLKLQFTPFSLSSPTPASLSSLQPPGGTVGFNTTEEIGMDCTCFPACSETTYELNAIDAKRSSNVRSSLL